MKRRFIATTDSNTRPKNNLAYLGYDSQTGNDEASDTRLRYATDTRIPTVGGQKTRKALDFYSVPAGEGADAAQASTTGAADQSVGLTSWIAAKFAAGASRRLTMAGIRLKNPGTATGPVIVEIRADNAGSPGAVIATSSIPAAAITGSYTYCTCRFVEAPLLVSGTSYWIVAYVQDDGTNTYSWSSTTTVTTAMVSSNSGASWSATSYGLNFTVYLTPDGGTLGHIRATKSDGTVKTLLAYKEAAGTTAVAVVSDLDGSLTAIKTGLNASATRYEFVCVNDTVYYVNGFDAPRKWDFTSEAAMGGSPAIASQIALHVNALFFVRADSPTYVFFSDPGLFETFTSTNFLYVPSPKTADWIVKMVPFNNQNMVLFTKKTKWVLAGSDISVMRLNRPTGIKGCVAADSVQQTLSYIYFASDDGAYQWNGATDILLTKDITNEYLAAANKQNMGSALWNNRYYLFYTAAGAGFNSECWVMNITYDCVESRDLATYVQKSSVWNGPVDDGRMVQASNLVGALYFAERSSNGYSNLGRPLTWEIRTKYEHYGSPAQEKEIPYWRPRFASGSGSYNLVAAYDLGFANSPTSLPFSLSAGGFILGSATPLLGAFTLGGNPYIKPELSIPQSAEYIQYRYSRTGVGTPAEFLGHTTDYFVIPL